MYVLLFKEGMESNTYGFSDLINYIVNYFNIDVYTYMIMSLPNNLYEDVRIDKLKTIKENSTIIICEDNYDYFVRLIEKSKINYKAIYKIENGMLKKIERNKELLA